MLFTKFIFLIFVWITEGSNWFLWQWVRQMCVTVFDKRHCTSRDVQSQHLREWNQRTDFDERKLLDTNKHSCLHIENLKSCPRRYKLTVLFFLNSKVDLFMFSVMDILIHLEDDQCSSCFLKFAECFSTCEHQTQLCVECVKERKGCGNEDCPWDRASVRVGQWFQSISGGNSLWFQLNCSFTQFL